MTVTTAERTKPVTPMLHVSGQHAHAVSMSCTCNDCEFGCKGNDGRLALHKLPHPLQMAYPVDRRCALNKKLHLLKTTTRVMESMMPTHGNGDFLLRILLKLRTSLYKDQEELCHQQSAQNETECAGAEALAPLQEWLGTFFGLSGQTFGDLHDEAPASNLTLTGACV
jgi:hypothetical protein